MHNSQVCRSIETHMSMKKSNVNISIIQRKFPARFKELPCECPPLDAVPNSFSAYRLTYNKADELCEDDFRPYDLDGSSKEFHINDPGSYAVSVFKDVKQLRNIQNFKKHRNKFIVKGSVKKKYGVCKEGKNHHVNLWLYEDATPWEDFIHE